MTLPYGDVDVAGAAEHDPELYQRAVARAGTHAAGLRRDHHPGAVLAERLPDHAGASGTPTRARRSCSPTRCSRTPRPRWPTPRATAWSSTSTGAAEGGPGPDSRTAITAMRQRLLSEAAVRFLRGDRAPLTMVLPHDWNPSDGSGPFFCGLDADWLDLTSVQGVSQRRRADDRRRRDPALPEVAGGRRARPAELRLRRAS